jgi:hypothetical protein
MKWIIALASFVLLLGGTAGSFAQSQPNYGPDGPSVPNTFGTPPTGGYPAGTIGYGYRKRYVYSYRYHHRRCWYRHHRRWCAW